MKPFHALIFSAACLLISEGAEIINGRVAKPHSRPYMAYIKIQKGHFAFICGGTLIDSRWVLTAAHCGIREGTSTVILGAHSSDDNATEEGRQIFRVTEILQHPQYNDMTMSNDIMLMGLNDSAELGKFVQKKSLPQTYEDIEAGTVCETAGWGWTGVKYADLLMEVNVTVLNRRACQRNLKNEVYITENMMCTNVGPRGQDTCNGDSGGPLICNGVFRGILSFGSSPCGKHNGAAVYTRLTKEYIDWINKEIGHRL